MTWDDGVGRGFPHLNDFPPGNLRFVIRYPSRQSVSRRVTFSGMVVSRNIQQRILTLVTPSCQIFAPPPSRLLQFLNMLSIKFQTFLSHLFVIPGEITQIDNGIRYIDDLH